MTSPIEPNPNITFAVIHEDEHVVVVTKPAHIPTQPGLGHLDDTLLNGMHARWGKQLSQMGAGRDFGLLHRLDRETSGLLIMALNNAAYDTLRGAFEGRRIKKFYWAVCARPPTEAKGVIELAIAESLKHKKKLAVISARGKPAATAYRTLSVSDHGAMLECRPLTGRLHQVRVHLNAIHRPILGDDFYAPAPIQAMAPRLALHAHRLVFDHPVTGKTIDARTPWPKDLRRLLQRLRLPRPDIAAGGAEAGDGPG